MSSSKHWITDPAGVVNIKTTLTGPASVPPETINELFKKICNTFPDKAALCVKRKGNWREVSYREYFCLVSTAAKSLIKLGLDSHHAVCIIGFNSPEWFFGYLGAIMAGGLAVGVYTTNSKDTCHYVAENCRAQVFLCENRQQLMKVLEVRDRLPNLKVIVQYTPADILPIDQDLVDAGVMSWEEFLAAGKDVPEYEVSWRMEAQKPGHCASIIYTSGTTGPPKGVMLSHDNLTWTAKVTVHRCRLTEDGHMISYLPLSHVAAQMTDIMAMLVTGHTMWFAQPDAMKGSLRDTLLDVRPTVFMGVPKVWETFKEAAELQLNQLQGLKGYLFEKAKNVGKQTSLNRQYGRDLPLGHWLSNIFVFSKVREMFGLDRCALCCSGAAPLPKAVSDFFYQFDIPICQIYGMSESSGVDCINTPNKFKPGAAGSKLDGVELKIDSPGPNGDGEICFRGRNVFMGYVNEERKTRAAIDDDGWLHTGDIGSVDAEGFCFITGRSKELIITKGGENIAPVPIEQGILESTRLLSYAMVIGDDQHYLTMFVTIKCKLDDSGSPTDELDPIVKILLNELGSKASTVTEVIGDLLVADHIQKCLDEVNEKAVNRASKVKKFVILPRDFSISGGELTPTMKLKRPVILEKYHDLMLQMYTDQS